MCAKYARKQPKEKSNDPKGYYKKMSQFMDVKSVNVDPMIIFANRCKTVSGQKGLSDYSPMKCLTHIVRVICLLFTYKLS